MGLRKKIWKSRKNLSGAVKTIKTKHGDIYDCVDFYKQPAFDHPLLKNHNFHPQYVLEFDLYYKYINLCVN
ncbi:hypothetical protein VitviT2T_002012 [Vitis vinifera]|uniref:Neprosin activation peptide domain-containing protein n=1 Tax=Vitis vinifera TaxID=29760 RepID=A0ABY9BIE4_VITVI|nr:hypothetical protein VitviT2T_002012 [Vitis vinifera]